MPIKVLFFFYLLPMKDKIMPSTKKDFMSDVERFLDFAGLDSSKLKTAAEDVESKLKDVFDAPRYPPRNVLSSKDSSRIVIQLAVAGFKKEEIKVKCGKTIIVKGETPSALTMGDDFCEDKSRTGISARPFRFEFPLPSSLSVKSVGMVDGLLSITLGETDEAEIEIE